MKKLASLLVFLPIVASANITCQTPWEEVPSPVKEVKTCRLSVPHGWLVFNFATNDMEIPNTVFYPDEYHEWNK